MLHVEPPKEWDDAAAGDAKADSVLHELLAEDLITEDERDFLAGMLTPAEAQARGFSEHLDYRAARIFQTFTSEDPRLWKAVGRGIKRVSAKVRIRREERAAVAAELAMRAVRNGPLGNRIKTTRAALERALRINLFWGKGQWVVSGRSPEELRDTALGELKQGGAGKATIELAAQALFWLTAYNVLTRESGNTIDQRSPQQLLTRLTESEHGVVLLYQTVIDGRAGTPPRAPKPDGKIMVNPASQAIPMGDEWLRRTFPTASTSSAMAPETAATPTQELDVRRRAVRSTVERVESAMDEMRAVRGVNGRPLVEEDGFPSDVADGLNTKLNAVVRELTRYGFVWDQRLPADNRDPSDDEPQELEP
jgi:hypothetical protein